GPTMISAAKSPPWPGDDVTSNTLGCQSRGGTDRMPDPAYRRVIVKVSGEALAGQGGYGVNQPTIDRIAADLVRSHALGIELGVVVGGGNILRGVAVSGAGLPRATADAMGMLATVVNALVLEAAIERAGASARTMSALAMPQVCETYERQRALRHLADDRIVLFAGGTGKPFFTTRTTPGPPPPPMGGDPRVHAPPPA